MNKLPFLGALALTAPALAQKAEKLLAAGRLTELQETLLQPA